MKVISSVISAIILVAIIYASLASAGNVQQTKQLQKTKGLSDLQQARNISPKTYNSQKTISGVELQHNKALNAERLEVK